MEVSNKGIELRNESDLKKRKLEIESKSNLQEKAKIYERLSKDGSNSKDFLVDFSEKKFEKRNKVEYEMERKHFYEAKRREIQAQQAALPSFGISKASLASTQERLHWESTQLHNLENNVTETSQQERILVKQRYDQKAGAEEKAILPSVLTSLAEERRGIDEMKKKRVELQEARKAKFISLINPH